MDRLLLFRGSGEIDRTKPSRPVYLETDQFVRGKDTFKYPRRKTFYQPENSNSQGVPIQHLANQPIFREDWSESRSADADATSPIFTTPFQFGNYIANSLNLSQSNAQPVPVGASPLEASWNSSSPVFDASNDVVNFSGHFVNDTSHPEGYPDLSWWALVLCIFIVAGIIGNCCVCVAIVTDRRLHNNTNYFLCSLAVADLMVSIIVMPFGLINELHYGYWMYDAGTCLFYISSDVFLSSVSIVHMSIISFDRYWGISRPLNIRARTKKALRIKMAACWLITIAISCPITVIGLIDSTNVYQGASCQIYNRYFMVYGSFLTFFIPFIAMAFTYQRTVALLKSQCGHNCHGASCQIYNRYFMVYGSFLTFFIPFIAMAFTYQRTVALLKSQCGHNCHGASCQIYNRYFMVYGSFLTFFIPFIVMAFTYQRSVALLKSQCGHNCHGASCQIYNRYFMVYGSFLTFFIPFIVMAFTYQRTVALLKSQCGHNCHGASCQIYNRYFMVYGSFLTFFIPFIVMAFTYQRTVALLKSQCGHNCHGGKGGSGVELRRSVRVPNKMRARADSTTSSINSSLYINGRNESSNSLVKLSVDNSGTKQIQCQRPVVKSTRNQLLIPGEHFGSQTLPVKNSEVQLLVNGGSRCNLGNKNNRNNTIAKSDRRNSHAEANNSTISNRDDKNHSKSQNNSENNNTVRNNSSNKNKNYNKTTNNNKKSHIISDHLAPNDSCGNLSTNSFARNQSYSKATALNKQLSINEKIGYTTTSYDMMYKHNVSDSDFLRRSSLQPPSRRGTLEGPAQLGLNSSRALSLRGVNDIDGSTLTIDQLCSHRDSQGYPQHQHHRFTATGMTKSVMNAASSLLPSARRLRKHKAGAERDNAVANEQKATKVLGVVFAAFFVCWSPFFSMNFTLGFCGPYCAEKVPPVLGSTVLWLGYISSILNPLIYTVFNRIYRENFANILRCRCVTSEQRRLWQQQQQHTTRLQSSVRTAAGRIDESSPRQTESRRGSAMVVKFSGPANAPKTRVLISRDSDNLSGRKIKNQPDGQLQPLIENTRGVESKSRHATSNSYNALMSQAKSRHSHVFTSHSANQISGAPNTQCKSEHKKLTVKNSSGPISEGSPKPVAGMLHNILQKTVSFTADQTSNTPPKRSSSATNHIGIRLATWTNLVPESLSKKLSSRTKSCYEIKPSPLLSHDITKYHAANDNLRRFEFNAPKNAVALGKQDVKIDNRHSVLQGSRFHANGSLPQGRQINVQDDLKQSENCDANKLISTGNNLQIGSALQNKPKCEQETKTNNGLSNSQDRDTSAVLSTAVQTDCNRHGNHNTSMHQQSADRSCFPAHGGHDVPKIWVNKVNSDVLNNTSGAVQLGLNCEMNPSVNKQVRNLKHSIGANRVISPDIEEPRTITSEL